MPVLPPGSHRRASLVPVTFVLLASLLLGACGTGEPVTKPTEPTKSKSSKPTKKATTKADELDDLFADSDSDGIPDRVQQEMGEDPAGDKCASQVCKAEEKARATNMAKIVRGTSTMIILDSSGSMVSKTKDGTTRMAAAKKAIRNYVDNAPQSTERLGLMVFGHEGSNQRSDRRMSCRGIDTLESVGSLTKDNVGGTLNQFEPTGWTPLGASIRAATKGFASERNRVNKIVVVSDGIDECGGNPQAEARKLRRSGFNVEIDVVGIGVKGGGNPTGKQLGGVAHATGGTYTPVSDTAGLESYFNGRLGDWVATAQLSECVAKQFMDYASCQAVRWQKAKSRLDAEVKRLRSAGKDTEADQLQRQMNQTANYYLKTLTSRGLGAAKNFTPNSAEVKQIMSYLEKTENGRAVLKANNVPCSAD
ncbi:MAG: VWA domain-containing protein [Streptosporangiales bacterium]|nr:VWA domain-containing protein [Streptosporangiales bacterium]